MTSKNEIELLEKNLWSQWAQFGAPETCSFTRNDSAYYLDTPIASLPYNGVFRFHEPCESDEAIDRLLRHYADRKVEHLWLIHPSAEPHDLADRLAARGLQEADEFIGMVLEPDRLKAPAVVPGGVDIRELCTGDEEVVIEFIAARWSVPTDAIPHLYKFFVDNNIGRKGAATRGWIATIDGKLVGKAFTHRFENTVGVYGVATRPEARGRGVARALCAKAFAETSDHGVDMLVLHSTEMASGIYEKFGFRSVAPFRLFASAGSFAA
ncbi:MAG: GNAT family N-acetyltransferase [Pseudomonadota bacterium]